MKTMKTQTLKKNTPTRNAFDLAKLIINLKPETFANYIRRLMEWRMDYEGSLAVREKIKNPAETTGIINYLTEKYRLRYNTVMGYAEYKSKDEDDNYWRPIDRRVANSFTIDARTNGINAWDKDISRYLQSDKIPDYNPVTDYLNSVKPLWDGKDYISILAKTVKTGAPLWERWFRTWLLAMVAQWRGMNSKYGNSVAPLLISGQGYNKSTFCRSLIPPTLQWGYTDNMSVENKRGLMLAMAEMLLINLDEFNQISSRNQEGFLKNLIQLASVKAKRPYGKHVEELPRLASFIATTNIADTLSDPSGNRRFIGIELTEPIDVSVSINHDQLYAQIMHLLDNGEKYWFDAEETKQIIEHNRQFHAQAPAMVCFNDMFEQCDDEREGQWRSTAEILTLLRKRYGTALKNTNMISFGRLLANMPGLLRRRTGRGTMYLVRER